MSHISGIVFELSDGLSLFLRASLFLFLRKLLRVLLTPWLIAAHICYQTTQG